MIYLECYADAVLVRISGISRKKIEHSHGKGNVCNQLKEKRNSRGLVDEDPFSNPYPYIEKLDPHSYENDIGFLYDRKNQNYVIVLHPRLEEWILKAAKEAKIDVTKYALPDDANDLHRFLNSRTKFTNFENFVKDIKKTGSKMLESLGKFANWKG